MANSEEKKSTLPFRMVGLVPLTFGLTLLWFIWSGNFLDDGFGDGPPLLFRIGWSLMALVPVAVGASYILFFRHEMTWKEAWRELLHPNSQTRAASEMTDRCPNCGAPPGEGTEIFSDGTVKCEHCLRRYSCHRPV